MSSTRTLATLGALGISVFLADCKVELCDRFPMDPRCSVDGGVANQTLVSPQRIPLDLTPATLTVTLASAPAEPLQITLMQNGKSISLGTTSTAVATIMPNLRSKVVPGPALIQVGNQQIAVSLYVTPVFNAPALQRPVDGDFGTAAMQPANPTGLGVTQAGKIIMLGQYGPPPFQGLKSYALTGSTIGPATSPNLSAYTGSRFSGTTVSGIALTNTHLYFPTSLGGTSTDLRQIDVNTAGSTPDSFFPFSALSLFTADGSGQLIAAVTTDAASSVKKLSFFKDADASLDSAATLDTPLDPNNIAFLGAGDFNGDNMADLAVWDTSGNVSVYLGTSSQAVNLKLNATYSSNLTAASKAVGASLAAVAIGDLDGDTLCDVAILSASGNVGLVLNGLNGAFGMPLSVPTGLASPSAIAIGNVNMDPMVQSSDLVLSSTGPSKLLYVLTNQATANWPN